ncbi:hypothetical protein WA158_002084 [Blastocystis sp. Blastoise]
MSDEDNITRQQDEIEMLKAVYPDLLEMQNKTHFKVLMSNTVDINPLVLSITLTDEYPSGGPPGFTLYAEWLSDEEIASYISEMFDQFYNNDFDVIIYNWIVWLNEKITSDSFLSERQRKMNNTKPVRDNKIEDNTDTVIEPIPVVKQILNIPTIIHSENFVDRKSTFQAHLAEVHSVEDVHAVIASLKEDNRILRATHNMWAYRIWDSNNNILYQDCDDDGEAMAGGKMSNLMSILEVQNVFVMVSRWFGGILLGPDRFKDINNMTRNILDQNGYIPEKHKKQKK